MIPKKVTRLWFADHLRAELLKTDTPIHVEASLVRTSTPAFFQAYEFKVALASEFHRRHAR